MSSQRRHPRLGIFQARSLSTASFLDYKKSNFVSPPLSLASFSSDSSKLFHLRWVHRPTCQVSPEGPAPRVLRREEERTCLNEGGGERSKSELGEPNFSAARELESRGARERSGPKPAAPEPPTPPPSARRCGDSAGGGGGGREAGRGRQTLPTRLRARNGRGSRRPERTATRAAGAGDSAPRLTPVSPNHQSEGSSDFTSQRSDRSELSAAPGQGLAHRHLPVPPPTHHLQTLPTHW